VPTKSYKKESYADWYDPSREKPTNEQLRLGCLQRIADATEAMAERHTTLLRRNEYLMEENKMFRSWLRQGSRREAGLRSYITRLKKKVAKLEEHADGGD